MAVDFRKLPLARSDSLWNELFPKGGEVCRSVPQGVRVKLFLDAGSVGRLLAGLPDRIGVDRLIPSMPAVAGKQPHAGLATQTAPVLAQRLQQLRAEHHIAVFPALSTLNMDDHALTVDVADL